MSERDRWGRPRGLTLQGEAIRDGLRRTALRLIAARGYARTTMRAIAKEMNVSPSLLYRYYPSKSWVVLELCEELSSLLFSRSFRMPRGTSSKRFGYLVRESVIILRERRREATALLSSLLDEANGSFPPGVFEAAARVRKIFETAVLGASDAPDEERAAVLTDLLVHTYFGVLLGWLFDRSPSQCETHELVSRLERALSVGTPFWVPQGAPADATSPSPSRSTRTRRRVHSSY